MPLWKALQNLPSYRNGDQCYSNPPHHNRYHTGGTQKTESSKYSPRPILLYNLTLPSHPLNPQSHLRWYHKRIWDKSDIQCFFLKSVIQFLLFCLCYCCLFFNCMNACHKYYIFHITWLSNDANDRINITCFTDFLFIKFDQGCSGRYLSGLLLQGIQTVTFHGYQYQFRYCKGSLHRLQV